MVQQVVSMYLVVVSIMLESVEQADEVGLAPCSTPGLLLGTDASVITATSILFSLLPLALVCGVIFSSLDRAVVQS